MSAPELNQQYQNQEVLDNVKAKYRQLEVGSLLILSGDSGRYQQMSLFVLCLIGVIESSIKFCLPYVFYQPSFMCPDAEGNLIPCPASEACKMGQRFLAYEVFGINAQFDLICEKHHLGVLASAITVFNGGMFSIILVLLADWIGRKMSFFVILGVHALGVSMMFFGQSSFMVTICGISLNYISMFAWFSIATLFLNESLGGRLRVISLPLIFVSKSCGLLFLAISYYFVNDYRWHSILQLGIMLAIGPFYWLYSETPFFAYRNLSLADVYSISKKIAYFNFAKKEARIRSNYIFKMLFDIDNDTQVTADHVEKGLGLPIEESIMVDPNLIKLKEELSSKNSRASGEKNDDLLDKSKGALPKSVAKEGDDISISISGEKVPDHLGPEFRMDPVLLDSIKKLDYESVHRDQIFPSQESNSYFDIFKGKFFFRLLGIVWLSMTVFTGNGLTAFSVQLIHIKSIFISGLFMGMFDLVGSLLGYYFSTVWSRRAVIGFSMSIFAFSSLSLLTLPFFESQFSEYETFVGYLGFAEAFLTFSIRFGVAFCNGLVFTYCTELFPTHLRTLSFGIFGFFGRSMFAFSEILIDFIVQLGWSPCSALSLFAVVALVAIILLPETAHKKMGN